MQILSDIVVCGQQLQYEGKIVLLKAYTFCNNCRIVSYVVNSCKMYCVKYIPIETIVRYCGVLLMVGTEGEKLYCG